MVWERMTEYYDARTMALFKEECFNEGREIAEGRGCGLLPGRSGNLLLITCRSGLLRTPIFRS